MRIIAPFFIYILISLNVYSQDIPKPFDKKPIEVEDIDSWVSVNKESPMISDNGAFVAYSLKNVPHKFSTTYLTSIKGEIILSVQSLKFYGFSADSKRFIYLVKDSLWEFNVESKGIRLLAKTHNIILWNDKNRNWIFFKKKNGDDILTAYNVVNDKYHELSNVVSFQFHPEQNSITYIKKTISENINSCLQLVKRDLRIGLDQLVYECGVNDSILSYNYDFKLDQYSWLLQSKNDSCNNLSYSVWYYSKKINNPREIFSSFSLERDKSIILNSECSLTFSADKNYLVLEIPRIVVYKKASSVDVWDYRDDKSMSLHLQDREQQEPKYYTFVCKVNDIVRNQYELINIKKENEELINTKFNIYGSCTLTSETLGGEKFWDRKINYYLVSLINGSRKLILSSSRNEYLWLSSTGNYVLIYNKDSSYYYSLNTSNGATTILTKQLEAYFGITRNGLLLEKPSFPVGIAGWIANTDFVLVYDNFDIWRLDLSGKTKPVNLSGEFGKKNMIKVRLVDDGDVLVQGQPILLSLLNMDKRFTGIYLTELGNKLKIERPVMGPFTIFYSGYENHAATELSQACMRPIKARQKSIWVYMKESVDTPPNLFVTNSFVDSKKLTNVACPPQINWMKAELFTWHLSDSIKMQGALFKPENFDSLKKYPVLISFYERKAGLVNQFSFPDLSGSTNFNIAWFVSHGYLVLAPDMYYRDDSLVKSVCNSVVSAAEALSKLHFVDSSKIGIGSYSWGGVQTNWVLSHTNVFAAVATGGGSMGGDPVSTAFQIKERMGKKAGSLTEYVEEGLRLGLLWENPSRWYDASPVLRADKITSPVLMLHNYDEYGWQYDIELFMALKRLQKPVWLLQYDKEGHSLTIKANKIDFTRKLTEFFDHFLKNGPVPSWMMNKN